MSNSTSELWVYNLVEWAQKYNIQDIINAYERRVMYENTKEAMLSILMLDISSKNLEEIPEFVFNLENLIAIDASHNHLSQISIKRTELNKLSYLNISWNHIEPIVEHLSCIKHLSSSWNRK